jgi:1-acyl-sn-glycerol-3-phosphate acyltransferase
MSDMPEVISDKAFARLKAVIDASRRRLFPIDAEGLEHVPSDGPAILAPNHISFLDSVFLASVLPRRIFFVGKAEYLDDWKTRRLFPALGMIPLDRRGGDAAQAALDMAAAVLEHGYLFGIFPEGTRSRDGKLYRGRTGVARLALRTGAPIVPVGIRDTDKVQPPGAPLPRPFRRCTFSFGPPIDVSHYREHLGDRPPLREITDEVMFEIRRLCGQEYVDRYNGKEVKHEETGIAADSPSEPSPAPRSLAGAVAPG